MKRGWFGEYVQPWLVVLVACVPMSVIMFVCLTFWPDALWTVVPILGAALMTPLFACFLMSVLWDLQDRQRRLQWERRPRG